MRRSAPVRSTRKLKPGAALIFSRNLPWPAGGRAAWLNGSYPPCAPHPVRRSFSAREKGITPSSRGMSLADRAPRNSILDRSTNPAALTLSSSAARVARSAMEWVTMTWPMPSVRLRRVRESTRSTMPDEARRIRHSSSMTRL